VSGEGDGVRKKRQRTGRTSGGIERMVKRVIAVGAVVLDQVYLTDALPREPTTVVARCYRERGGGPAATGAVAVAGLGGEANLWARVGDDPIGRRIAEELSGWGVWPTLRFDADGRSGVSTTVEDAAGRRLVVAFADSRLDPDPSWLPVSSLDDADAVLCDLSWPRATERVLKEAGKIGVPVVLDADPASPDLARRVMPLADYALFSEPGLQRLTGMADPHAGLAEAQTYSGGMVGVMLGQGGFHWLDAGAAGHVTSFAAAAADARCAGHVFHGAFALAIAEGLDVAHAARFASAAATLNSTRAGDWSGIPSRAEVDGLVAAEPVA
jgi:sulfofructose kinase